MARGKKTGKSMVESTIELEAKARPRQARSQDTYEVVLSTAGAMLTEKGFEQLTTNGICARAGLTPPALYRYFPNKYAILKVLGERLMAAQDTVIVDWIRDGGIDDDDIEIRIRRLENILNEIIRVTSEFPGGVAIIRAIRAVPMLQELHLASRDHVAGQYFEALRSRNPKVPEARLRVATRMIGGLSSAVIQMVMEEPQERNDWLVYETAYLFSWYFRSLRADPPADLPY